MHRWNWITLSDRTTAHGAWWTPSEPDTKYSGTLTFSRDSGGILELTIPDPPKDFGAHFKDSNVIFGETTDMEKITLAACFTLGRSMVLPADEKKPSPVGTWRISTSLAFVGAHFADCEEAILETASVRYRNLYSWIWMRGINVEFGRGVDLDLSYRAIPPETIEIDEDSTITLAVHLESYPMGPDADGAITLRELPLVSFHTNTPRSFNDLYEEIRCVEAFLSIATMCPCPPLDIWIESPRPEGEANGEAYHVPVRVLFISPDSDPSGQSRHPGDFLFSRGSVVERLPDLLRHWVTARRDLRPMYMLYMAAIGAHPSVEWQFLSLVQAIEAYHKIRHSDVLLSPAFFKSTIVPGLLSSIPEGVPREWREEVTEEGLMRLRSKAEASFMWLNEFALRHRLRALFAENSNEIGRFVKDPKATAEKIVRWRNTFIHTGRFPTSEGSIDENLVDLTSALRGLMELCFLREMGFTEKERTELVRHNRELRNRFLPRWPRGRERRVSD